MNTDFLPKCAGVLLAACAMCYSACAPAAPRSVSEVTELSRRVIADGFLLSVLRRVAAQSLKLVDGATIVLAASFALSPCSAKAGDMKSTTLKVSKLPIATQGSSGNEPGRAASVVAGNSEVQPGSQASTPAAHNQGTLADEAPQITPVDAGDAQQARSIPQGMTPPIGAQGTLADEAPHITPIAPGRPASP